MMMIFHRAHLCRIYRAHYWGKLIHQVEIVLAYVSASSISHRSNICRVRSAHYLGKVVIKVNLFFPLYSLFYHAYLWWVRRAHYWDEVGERWDCFCHCTLYPIALIIPLLNLHGSSLRQCRFWWDCSLFCHCTLYPIAPIIALLNLHGASLRQCRFWWDCSALCLCILNFTALFVAESDRTHHRGKVVVWMNFFSFLSLSVLCLIALIFTKSCLCVWCVL